MKHLAIEGGCWQFVSDPAGDHYQLMGNNTDSLFVDGLWADIIVRDTTGLASICMTGKIVKVLEITKISQP